jgi:hypothetical protein
LQESEVNSLKSTFEEAEKVAEALGEEYEKADWLRGIAVKYGDLFGFYVEVRVADVEKAEIPEAVDGVWVFVEERSEAIVL